MEFLIFIYGLCIGSFLNVVIWRLPRDEKISGRSKCPSCGHKLLWFNLIPVISYVWQFGRCKYCRQLISPRYLTIEIITGLLFLFCFIFLAPNSLFGLILFIKYCVILAILLCVFVIDLEHYLILDKIIFPASFLILVLNIVLQIKLKLPWLSFESPFFGGLLAAICFAFLFLGLWFFSKGRALGFGDVKLAIFLGLALGWPLFWAGLLLSIFLGGLVSLILMLVWKKGLKTKLPFGTFLSVGFAASLFWGKEFLSWYLGILGF